MKELQLLRPYSKAQSVRPNPGEVPKLSTTSARLHDANSVGPRAGVESQGWPGLEVVATKHIAHKAALIGVADHGERGMPITPAPLWSH